MKTVKNQTKNLYSVMAFLIIIALFYYINPAKLLPDDSLFYIVIAEYIVDMGTSTFNGLIETNGYHPLWMILNILAVFIGKILSIDPLYIVGLMYHLLIGSSIVYIFKLQSLWKGFSATATSLLLIFLFISNGVLQNMESALALFFVAYSVYMSASEKIQSNLQYFMFGIVLGLLVLSRLDLIFFGSMLGIAFVIMNFKTISEKPSKLMVFILGGLLIVLPYLIYNQIHFGSIMPISGALKSSYPSITFSWNRLFPYGTMGLLAALIALIIATFATKPTIKMILVVLSLSTIAHAFYLAMFQFPMTWYYITGYLLLALVTGVIAKKLQVLPYAYETFILILMIISLLTSYFRLTTDFTLRRHILQHQPLIKQKNAQFKLMAENIASALPENAVVMTWDLPGVLAYYGRLKVFSADGLISNKKYQDDLVNIGAHKLFERYNIGYIVVPISAEGTYYEGMSIKHLQVDDEKAYKITIFSRFYHKDTGTIILKESDIIYRTPMMPDTDTKQIIGVFKMAKFKAVWH